MHKDRVPNVRLTLAKAIRSHFKSIGGAFIYDKAVNKVVKHLSEDVDRDVKYLVQDIMTYAQGESSETSSVNSRLSDHEDTQTTTFYINTAGNS